MTSKTDALKTIRDEVWALTQSPLYKERVENGNYPVLGEGSHDARIMFIGEAPGKNEAKEGRPFCGAAGKILDELLEHIGVPRVEVYITNVVKDRPPNNRDPLTEEIELYAPFLDRQIEVIQPQVLAALGRHSMKYVLERYGSEIMLPTISEAHGKDYAGKLSYGEVVIIPLYHPAVAVYDASKKDELKKDFEVLKQYCSGSK